MPQFDVPLLFDGAFLTSRRLEYYYFRIRLKFDQKQLIEGYLGEVYFE